MTLSPGAKVQPNLSTLRSPAGFNAACSSMLSEPASLDFLLVQNRSLLEGGELRQADVWLRARLPLVTEFRNGYRPALRNARSRGSQPYPVRARTLGRPKPNVRLEI